MSVGMGRKLVTAFAYGVSFGTLFYILGAVADTVVPGVSATTAAVLGFSSAAAIELAKGEESKK